MLAAFAAAWFALERLVKNDIRSRGLLYRSEGRAEWDGQRRMARGEAT